jgi:predicted PurR-regulated permease PerM
MSEENGNKREKVQGKDLRGTAATKEEMSHFKRNLAVTLAVAAIAVVFVVFVSLQQPPQIAKKCYFVEQINSSVPKRVPYVASPTEQYKAEVNIIFQKYQNGTLNETAAQAELDKLDTSRLTVVISPVGNYTSFGKDGILMMVEFNRSLIRDVNLTDYREIDCPQVIA